MITRRHLLATAGGLSIAACVRAEEDATSSPSTTNREVTVAKAKSTTIANYDEWQLTNKEWKERLSADAYAVLRKEATERPFTSPLNDEKRDGIFSCAGCNLDIFTADTKYDSRTGWPSFFNYIPGSLETKTDFKIGLPRTEYHCARCGGHQGHVFKDGPNPTGLRYCNNGVALTFTPA